MIQSDGKCFCLLIMQFWPQAQVDKRSNNSEILLGYSREKWLPMAAVICEIWDKLQTMHGVPFGG